MAAALLAAGVAVRAWGGQTADPLLDLMLNKGMITEEEARKVQAEADAIRTNGAARMPDSRWKMSSAIKNVELFGDLRLRFEDRAAKDPNGGQIDLQRLRYALRLGLRGEVFDDFYYGFRLDTAANPRSPWVTFGSSSSGVPYQGPFGKSTAGINLGQIYLGWRAKDWMEITLGKMSNPFYTTPMVWDPDLNPEGAAERFRYTVGSADLFATFGQFLYQDTSPNQSSPGYFNNLYTRSTPPVLLGWQIGMDYHITTNLDFKVAPVLYSYTGRGVNANNGFTPDFGGVFIGQGTIAGVNGAGASSSGYPGGPYDGFVANQTGINDLLVLDVPFELNYRTKNLTFRVFGDFAENLDGANRAQNAFAAQQSPLFVGTGLQLIPSAQTHDDKAYQVGLGVGSSGAVYGPSQGLVYGTTARKNTWEMRGYWQHVEQYALDPNLLDSDFFEGRGNLEGFYAALAYGLTDNMIATFRYGYASRINNKLGTGGSNQDIPQMNPISHYDILQLDLSLRF
jgi:hypothetical protein